MAGKNTGRKPPPGTKTETDEGEGEGEGEENYVTESQLNAAVTKAISRFGAKTLPKILQKQLTETLAAAGFKAKGDDDEEGEGEGEGEGEEEPEKKAPAAARPAKKAPAEAAPAAPSADAKKLAKLQKEMDLLRTEREEAAKKQLADEEKTALKDQLTAQGVRKEMIGPLSAWLLGEDSGKAVRRSAEGKIVFLQGEGEDGDEVPLKDGLASWLKTDTGKTYLAPRQVGGSGLQMPGQRGAAPAARPGSAAAQQGRDSADDELFGAVMGVVSGGNPLS